MYKIHKITFFLSLIIFSTKCLADEWTKWKEINLSQASVNINQNINEHMGVDEYLSVWRSDGKMGGGGAAFQIDVIKESANAKLEISHLKLPEGWIISGSENDKKYLISVVDYFFNYRKPVPKNPIKKIGKKEIQRYRDINNKVVPHTIFDFNNQVCLAFFKEFYKHDSGFASAAEADETIRVLYCKYNGSISKEETEVIIDSVIRK